MKIQKYLSYLIASLFIMFNFSCDQLMQEVTDLCTAPITDPGEGDPPYGVIGPYGYNRIKDTGPNNEYDIYIPATFKEDQFLHPIINWANGGVSFADTYVGLHATWATWGFVVVAGHTDFTEYGISLNAGCDWIVEQNSNPDSIYYNKLDVSAIGASGHSSGGAAVIDAAATAPVDRPHITVTVPMMPTYPWISGATQLQKGPMLILADRDDILCWWSMNSIYEESNVLTMMLIWNGGHEDAIITTIVRNPSTAWFRMHLMQGKDGYNDDGASNLFYSNDSVYTTGTTFELLRRNTN